MARTQLKRPIRLGFMQICLMTSPSLLRAYGLFENQVQNFLIFFSAICKKTFQCYANVGATLCVRSIAKTKAVTDSIVISMTLTSLGYKICCWEDPETWYLVQLHFYEGDDLLRPLDVTLDKHIVLSLSDDISPEPQLYFDNFKRNACYLPCVR